MTIMLIIVAGAAFFPAATSCTIASRGDKVAAGSIPFGGRELPECSMYNGEIEEYVMPWLLEKGKLGNMLVVC